MASKRLDLDEDGISTSKPAHTSAEFSHDLHPILTRPTTLRTASPSMPGRRDTHRISKREHASTSIYGDQRLRKQVPSPHTAHGVRPAIPTSSRGRSAPTSVAMSSPGQSPHRPLPQLRRAPYSSSSLAANAYKSASYTPSGPPKPSEPEPAPKHKARWRTFGGIFARKPASHPTTPTTPPNKTQNRRPHVPQYPSSLQQTKMAVSPRPVRDSNRLWLVPRQAHPAPSFDDTTKRPPPPPKDPPRRPKTLKQPPIPKNQLLEVSIPDISMERYSVMFGNILSPRDSSLLARRQANLEKLKLPTASINKQARRAEEKHAPLPRRVTDPLSPAKPSTSLPPPRSVTDPAPSSAKPSPRLPPPRRVTDPTSGSAKSSPTFSLFPMIPPNARPARPPTPLQPDLLQTPEVKTSVSRSHTPSPLRTTSPITKPLPPPRSHIPTPLPTPLCTGSPVTKSVPFEESNAPNPHSCSSSDTPMSSHRNWNSDTSPTSTETSIEEDNADKRCSKSSAATEVFHKFNPEKFLLMNEIPPIPKIPTITHQTALGENPDRPRSDDLPIHPAFRNRRSISRALEPRQPPPPSTEKPLPSPLPVTSPNRSPPIKAPPNTAALDHPPQPPSNSEPIGRHSNPLKSAPASPAEISLARQLSLKRRREALEQIVPKTVQQLQRPQIVVPREEDVWTPKGDGPGVAGGGVPVGVVRSRVRAASSVSPVCRKSEHVTLEMV